MGESERERDRERETSLSPSLMFLSPSLSNGFGTGLLSSAFSPKDKGKCKVGRGAAGWDLGRQGVGEGEGREKRSKWPVHENEEQISKPNIPREEKKKGESKNYWGTTFFFSSSFLLFSFFLVWRE